MRLREWGGGRRKKTWMEGEMGRQVFMLILGGCGEAKPTCCSLTVCLPTCLGGRWGCTPVAFPPCLCVPLCYGRKRLADGERHRGGKEGSMGLLACVLI